LREKRLEKIKFDILKPKAHAFDVDPTGDYHRPGNSPPERAFQVLTCALEMLVYLIDEGAFPAVDNRARKRGSKWTRQALLFNGGAGALVLAHGITTLMVQLEGRFSDDEPDENVIDVSRHRRLMEAVRSFYPLPRDSSEFMERCLAEFKVMETHKPRDAIVEYPSLANEYSRALLNGENPDDDPALVAMQKEYARDFFIDRATFSAFNKAIDKKDRRILNDKMVRFTAVKDPRQAAELRQRALAAWIEGSRPYREYARIDSG
jgi:hypothetical protein